MLEYVYIRRKRDTLKVPCSQLEGNLPDFCKTDYTAESYVKAVNEAEKWESYLNTKKIKEESYLRLSLDNFELFCNNFEEILSKPQFANIRYEFPLWWCKYGSIYGTIGEALTLWQTDNAYNGKKQCTHEAAMKAKETCLTDKSVKPVHIIELLNHLGKFSEDEGARLLNYYINPQKEPKVTYADICVPQRAWTERFAVAALKASLPFGYLPARFKTQEFIDKTAAETDWIPNIAEISSMFLTVEVCVKSICKNKAFKSLKCVPAHLKAGVTQMLRDIENENF